MLTAFLSGPARLFTSFARRLSYLDREPRAVAIAERLLADGGALGDVAALAGERWRAFLRPRDVCRALLSRRTSNSLERDFGQLAQTLLKRFPIVVLDELVGTDAPNRIVDRFFGGPFRDDDDQDGADGRLDAEIAMAWVATDPAGRALRLARHALYCVRDEERGGLVWSDLALRLIDIAPDPVRVTQPVGEAGVLALEVGQGRRQYLDRLVLGFPGTDTVDIVRKAIGILVDPRHLAVEAKRNPGPALGAFELGSRVGKTVLGLPERLRRIAQS